MSLLREKGWREVINVITMMCGGKGVKSRSVILYIYIFILGIFFVSLIIFIHCVFNTHLTIYGGDSSHP